MGKAEYEEFIDEVIANAQHELCIFDQRLGTTFNSRSREEALRQFLLSSRRNRLRWGS